MLYCRKKGKEIELPKHNRKKEFEQIEAQEITEHEKHETKKMSKKEEAKKKT